MKTIIKIIRVLTIVPIAAAILNGADLFLPHRIINTKVIEKDSEHHFQYDLTSFSVDFEGIRGNVTEEIYNSLNKGDSVLLSIRYFQHEIDTIKKIPENQSFNNDVDVLAIMIFSILFFVVSIFTLVFLKTNPTSTKQKVINIIIFISFSLALLFSLLNLINIINPSYSSI